MHDLDKWRWLLKVPQQIPFRQMILLGGDFDPPVAEGSGLVTVESASKFLFQLDATAVDRQIVAARQQRLRENPYDALARFRVQAHDENDQLWHLGWTEPEFTMQGDQVVVRGLCEGLSTDIDSTSDVASTTTLYRLQDIAELMSLVMIPEAGEARDTYRFSLDGSSVELRYNPNDCSLTASATHSDALSPPYIENWLGEPLRILLGQLIFPSLVARDVSNRNAFFSVRRTPNVRQTGGIASYFRYLMSQSQLPSFWKFYEKLLRYISSARGKDGQPHFESNPTTRLCEEIVQAEYLGSRWILALTLASAIESQARRLEDRVPTAGSDDAEQLRDQLIKYIQEWRGEEGLKRIAVSAIQRSVELTTPKILRALLQTESVTKDQLSAWHKVRNSVVHGNLISPYSSEKEDSDILAMTKMFHSLTTEVISISGLSA